MKRLYSLKSVFSRPCGAAAPLAALTLALSSASAIHAADCYWVGGDATWGDGFGSLAGWKDADGNDAEFTASEGKVIFTNDCTITIGADKKVMINNLEVKNNVTVTFYSTSLDNRLLTESKSTGTYSGEGTIVLKNMRLAGNAADLTVSCNVVIDSVGAKIYANGGNTTKLTGSLSGTGNITLEDYKNNSTGMFVFAGDCSQYTGTISASFATDNSYAQFDCSGLEGNSLVFGGSVNAPTDKNSENASFLATAGTYTFGALEGKIVGSTAATKIVITGEKETGAKTIEYTAGSGTEELEYQGSNTLTVNGGLFETYTVSNVRGRIKLPAGSDVTDRLGESTEVESDDEDGVVLKKTPTAEEALDAKQIAIETTVTKQSTGKNISSESTLAVSDATLLTGHGGTQITSSLTVNESGTLVLDPVHLPVYVAATPTISGKLALSEYYKNYTLGKMVLLTWDGDALESLPEFTNTTSAATATLSQQLAPDGTHRQLVLTLGDYDENKTALTILPIGDSITEGCDGSFNNSNYRIPLCEKLTAAGYDVTTKGWLQTVPKNGTNIKAPVAWRSHSGRGGSKLIWYPAPGGKVRGAIREQIEALLDQAGEPDIITFKIGTNDFNHDNDGDSPEYTTAEVLFDSLTNVLWRIHAYRPTTKVVVATLLDMNKSDGWEKTRIEDYVGMIRDLGANAVTKYGFPENFVFVNDVYNLLERGATDFAAADNVHPSWCGHEKFAEAWYTAITNALAQGAVSVGGTPCTAFAANTTSGAANNVPETYRNGFVQAATLDLTSTFTISKGTAPTYTTTSSGAPANYSKVAYYLELKRTGSNHRRFVWVDMDAFKKRNLATCGFPSDYTKQGVVNNLHVYSNDPAVHNIAADKEGETGWVEFFPNSYGAGLSGLDGAMDEPSTVCGWNDTMGSGKHGSFQVFRKFANGEYFGMPAEVVFCHNGWSSGSSYINEIGIGNFAQHVTGGSSASTNGTIDYTSLGASDTEELTYSTMNASAYEVMKLEIWVRECDAPPVPDSTYTWSGAENNLWSNPKNWLLDDTETVATYYPGEDDDTGDTYAVKFPVATSTTVDVDVDATVNNFNMPETSSGTANLLTLTGDGTISIISSGDVLIGKWRNLTLDGASIYTMNHWFGPGNNAGVLTIKEGSTLSGYGLYIAKDNSAVTIVDGGTVDVSDIQVNVGVLIVSNGTVNVSSSLRTKNSTSSTIDVEGGEVSASTLNLEGGGKVVVEGGSVAVDTMSNYSDASITLGENASVSVTDTTSAIALVEKSGNANAIKTTAPTKTVMLGEEEVDITSLCKGVVSGGSVVAVLDETKVQPEFVTDGSKEPMEMGESAVTFHISNFKKGLYYGVKSGSDVNTLTAGTLTQCTDESAGVTLTADMPDSGVQFYKVVVSDTSTVE